MTTEITNLTGAPIPEGFDLEDQLAYSRARQDLFERKNVCELQGIPFEPTEEEQAVLARMESARLAHQGPSMADRRRANDLEMANLSEQGLFRRDGTPAHPPEAMRRIKAEIRRLRTPYVSDEEKERWKEEDRREARAQELERQAAEVRAGRA
jgi:hypothetical protein